MDSLVKQWAVDEWEHYLTGNYNEADYLRTIAIVKGKLKWAKSYDQLVNLVSYSLRDGGFGEPPDYGDPPYARKVSDHFKIKGEWRDLAITAIDLVGSPEELFGESDG